ncbi:MAG TPA: FAD-dependent oxidoreductase [Candidatus Binataceae bacterium]|nr:FAD-dependent oxidoreductase [Candidatus Binataceae bacterium]
MSQSTTDTQISHVRCCIAGGGPAGMVLGYLLARAGVEVLVLEKHGDFLRDFRGDTIHPSTLEIMYELGVLEEFLKQPHQEARELSAQIGDTKVTIGDFTHLPTRCKFIAFMPQWDFLNFIARQAKTCSAFQLRMQTEVTDIIREGDRVVGVRALTPRGSLEVRSDLVVGTDGRHSTVREKAGLHTMDLGAPMDVLWMRLTRHPTDGGQTLGRIDTGRIFVMIDREEYWQCAYVIRKGSYAEIRRRGLPAFREELSSLAPFLGERANELASWDDIKLLTVAADRLKQWYQPGLLCIGDAAHAMSPIGGVGINLAVQDAVATANILVEPLLRGTVTIDDLREVQKRREWPTRMTQGLQDFIQRRVIGRVLVGGARPSPPWVVKLLDGWPYLRRLPARIVGMGFRPEHVRTPEAGNAKVQAT